VRGDAVLGVSSLVYFCLAGALFLAAAVHHGSFMVFFCDVLLQATACGGVACC
jgi:hypothetical protein